EVHRVLHLTGMLSGLERSPAVHREIPQGVRLHEGRMDTEEQHPCQHRRLALHFPPPAAFSASLALSAPTRSKYGLMARAFRRCRSAAARFPSARAIIPAW